MTTPDSNVFNRRNLLIGAVAGLAVAGVAGCTSTTSGSAIGANVTSVNDLTGQQANLTIAAYNAVKDNPECQYPSSLLKSSLELANQRKKLLRFNEPTKVGWIHLFLEGVGLVGTFGVLGKVSSLQSSMTADVGVYTATANSDGISTVPVELPGDDLSFGQNEDGVFWFTPEGIYMTWSGKYFYTNTALQVKLNPALVQPTGAKPTASKA